MMDAYIDRDATVESLNAMKPFLRDRGQVQLLRRIMNHIGKIPVADVVPVVRCKDCEHSFVLGESELQKEAPYKYYRKDVLMCGCEEHFGDYPESVDTMFFCGYGERKDGD